MAIHTDFLHAIRQGEGLSLHHSGFARSGNAESGHIRTGAPELGLMHSALFMAAHSRISGNSAHPGGQRRGVSSSPQSSAIRTILATSFRTIACFIPGSLNVSL